MTKSAGLPSTIFSKKKSGAGFTLIEILVVAAISAILFGVGIAAFRGIGARQNLKQAGNEFQSNLRSFQQKALSSEKPSGCGGSLEDFKVWSEDSDLTIYSVKAECSITDGSVREFSLTDGVSFGDNFSVSFLVLQAGVVGAQTITLTNGSLNYEVTIGPKGVITGEMQ